MNDRDDALPQTQQCPEPVGTIEAELLGTSLAAPPRPEITHNGHDSRDARLRQILMAIVAFREGDFTVRLPTDWGDIEGRIAETFNQTIAQEDRISREITRLSVMVGKEG